MANLVREEIEWCNLWVPNAPDAGKLPRVLLIGDSISCSYNGAVSEFLQGVATVDRLGTSRSLNDPCLHTELRYALGLYDYQLVHFNNGLHGWHLKDDASEYGAGLRDMYATIRLARPSAKLVFALSTPVTVKKNDRKFDPERNPRVLRRNETATALMRELEVPLNDLYACALTCLDQRSGDGYHFQAEGARVLGRQVADAVRQYL